MARAEAIDEAIACLRAGGVVVYPTETLYGLGCDATDEAALRRLAALKGRDAGKPISVLVASRDELGRMAAAPSAEATRLMEAFWPGPLTIVLRARPELSKILTGGGQTIGARVSPHPVARALAEGLARPLTATSANPGGETPPATAAAARAYFGDRVDAYVDDGATPGGPASTVVDCSGSRPLIVREGAVATAALARVLGVEAASLAG